MMGKMHPEVLIVMVQTHLTLEVEVGGAGFLHLEGDSGGHREAHPEGVPSLPIEAPTAHGAEVGHLGTTRWQIWIISIPVWVEGGAVLSSVGEVVLSGVGGVVEARTSQEDYAPGYRLPGCCMKTGRCLSLLCSFVRYIPRFCSNRKRIFSSH